MSIEALIAWLMILMRSVGVMLLMPTVGSRPLPVTVRLAFGGILASLMYGVVPRADPLSGGWYALAASTLGEVLLGLLLGFFARMIFYAVEMAGRLITMQIGLTAAPGIDAPTPTSEPLAAAVSSLAVVIFFLVGGHLGVLAAFARSFELAPAGAPGFAPDVIPRLIRESGYVIELGFRMAAPFVALDFLITLGFSVLGRAVPRMGVFVMSYAVKLLVGFSLLAGSGALFVRYLNPEFTAQPFKLLELVGRWQG